MRGLTGGTLFNLLERLTVGRRRLEDNPGEHPGAEFVAGHDPKVTGGVQALTAGTLLGEAAGGAIFLQEGTLTWNGRVGSVAIGLRETVAAERAGTGGLVRRAAPVVRAVSILAAVEGAGLADGGRSDADTSRAVQAVVGPA